MSSINGTHSSFELSGIAPEKLTDIAGLSSFICNLAKNIGFSSQALPQLFQYKGEGVWGVTGVIKDDQAHLSIHTFPDQGKFFLGVYAASEIAEQDVLQQLMAAFNPAKHQVTHFDQGEELDQIVAAESGLVERPRIYH